MASFEGGCACGAVRYRLTSAPMFVNACHCLDCKRQTGGAFAVNALIEADRVQVERGEIAVYSMPTDSGRPHDIHRCAACATALWSDYGRRGWLRFVRVMTLDNPEALKPDAHIFTRTKLPWLSLAADVPAFEVYYDMASQWPAESLARREAASLGGKT